MGVIRIIEPNGASHDVEAVEGWRVMEIIREHGFDIEGLCGGACACATCHVHVEEEWVGRLHPPRDEEEAALDTVPAAESTSRLSCQIIYHESLDGLAVRLAEAA